VVSSRDPTSSDGDVAAVDYFLKIDGIPGESQDSKHKGEIELESFSWGATQAGSLGAAGGVGAGKVQMQDFHFVMTVNKASPKLFLACASGQHLKQATLVARKAGKAQQEFLVYKFTDVLVSSYQSAGAGESVPMDSVSLNFGKIEFEFRPEKPDGSLAPPAGAGWDVKKNKRI
jgi:type VI secretion system secreted protein Hcp